MDASTQNARDDFIFPTNAEIGASMVPEQDAAKPCTYLCGNSLGLVSKRSKTLVLEELDVWARRAVQGHFDHPHGRNWKDIADHAHPTLAQLVGAKPAEVACMSTLTSNLHLMMDTFYRPTKDRYKILCEAKAFPSDQYAFASQARAHGLDPELAVVKVSPREGEYTLRQADILEAIEREGESLALVLFSGVQYYTGQWFPMASITAAGKQKGVTVGWDLAHAIGNVPMQLHEWGVDFAVWCSYKYLNSGPGGIGGLFVHERWHGTLIPRQAGWWGHDPDTRFDMPEKFSPIAGAQGFQQSNPSVLATASLLGSLEHFQRIGGMDTLRPMSITLTRLLESHLRASRFYVDPDAVDANGDRPRFTIITPRKTDERGSQLSLLFLPPDSGVMRRVFEFCVANGVLGDERNPDVIRLAPTALYNTEQDCKVAADVLERAMRHVDGTMN